LPALGINITLMPSYGGDVCDDLQPREGPSVSV